MEKAGIILRYVLRIDANGDYHTFSESVLLGL